MFPTLSSSAARSGSEGTRETADVGQVLNCECRVEPNSKRTLFQANETSEEDSSRYGGFENFHIFRVEFRG